jgi:hypothetical protein
MLFEALGAEQFSTDRRLWRTERNPKTREMAQA